MEDRIGIVEISRGLGIEPEASRRGRGNRRLARFLRHAPAPPKPLPQPAAPSRYRLMPARRGRRCGRAARPARLRGRSEEHTSELQSLMRISYAVFCLKKKKTKTISSTRMPPPQLTHQH